MKRLLLQLEYNGAAYYGWQRNSEVVTIQSALEDALFQLTGETLKTFAAGRTDAGVHALSQFAHVDVNTDKLCAWPLIKFWDGLNHFLRPLISVKGVGEVPADFHVRFSATSRRYRYLILNRRTIHPHWHERAALIRQPLDIARMQTALHLLPQGEADWAAFQSADCASSTSMVHVFEVSLAQTQPFSADAALLTLEIEADHFLQHMVRTLVGTLVEVGIGKREPDQMTELFKTGERVQAGYNVPGHGLYLTKVTYPAVALMDSVGNLDLNSPKRADLAS